MLVTNKKLAIILCSIVLIFAVHFIWSNVLILDDRHPMSIQALQGEFSLSNSYHIEIDLDKLELNVYNGEELVATYPCSGGAPNTPSPLGTWVIISKDTWGEGFGGAWLGFNVPWGAYGIHGTDSPWFIGRSNASKGCIRMINKDVKELYKMVPHGTTVTIVHENRTFRNMKDGDVGSDVKEMQELLKDLGYYTGYPDGVYGQYLEKAVRKFQKDNKLWVSGTIYKNVYNLIIQKASEQTPASN